MTLVFQLLCLFITLYVLQKYVVAVPFSRRHRMLPLVLGLIGVYNFYEIIGYITQEKPLFNKMEDLLVLHILYLLLFYIGDILDISIPEYARILLFVSLLAVDIIAILLFRSPEKYRSYYLIDIGIYVLLICVFGTYSYVRYTYSAREHRVTNMLYLALLAPTISVGIHAFAAPDNFVIAPAGLMFSCMVILYLIFQRQFVEGIAGTGGK